MRRKKGRNLRRLQRRKRGNRALKKNNQTNHLARTQKHKKRNPAERIHMLVTLRKALMKSQKKNQWLPLNKTHRTQKRKKRRKLQRLKSKKTSNQWENQQLATNTFQTSSLLISI